MLKTALFDRAINKKCCSVDGGRGICPLFSSPPGGFDSSRVPTPGNLPSKAKKKCQCPGVSLGGGGGKGWAQLALTDALRPPEHVAKEISRLIVLSRLTRPTGL